MGPLEKPRQELLSELSAAPPSSGGSSSPDSIAPGIVAAALSAAASIGSNIYSNYRNRQLAEQQNQWNLEQWNRENRYNDPSNQVERLRRAGINPALAYANGDLMNEAAASPQMTSALGHITSPVQIDPLTFAQVRNLDAQTKSTEDANARENEKQGLTLKTLAANVENLVSSSLLARSSSALNSVLQGKARQEQANLLQQWEQSNEAFSYHLSKLKADSEISQEEARFAAKRLQSSIDAAEALAKYNNEQAKYVKDNAVTARVNALAADKAASAAEQNAETNFGNALVNARLAGEKLRKLSVEVAILLHEEKIIDKTELARIAREYVDLVKELR